MPCRLECGPAIQRRTAARSTSSAKAAAGMLPALLRGAREVGMVLVNATARRRVWERKGVVEVIFLLGLVSLPMVALLLDR